MSTIKYYLKRSLLILSFLEIASIVGCKKFIEVAPPVTRVSALNAYNTDATAAAVLTGLYTKLSSITFNTVDFSNLSGLISGLSSDELSLWSGQTSVRLRAYYRNNLSPNLNTGSEIWNNLYPYIFICNAAIEGLGTSTRLTPSVNDQLMGEAKFMRAFFYFYLVNLFGDVPLVVSTDYEVTSRLTRSTKQEVYQQIVKDLLDAQNLLSPDYLNSTVSYLVEDRVRPTKWAAIALLARTYLYLEDWSNAELMCTQVISQNSLFELTTLEESFLKNSKESIWQLQPVNIGWNTEHARLLILPATGPSSTNSVYLNTLLVGAFELGDNRKNIWVKSISVSSNTFYYPFKYKSKSLNAPVTEYLTVLRLGEQYLIRAEARIKQSNISGAMDDLNIIRNRASLSSIQNGNLASIYAAIQRERRVELFSEWGHRWLDLKRTNSVDSVMSIVTPLKSGGMAWASYQQVYPIPLGEIQRNNNLVQTTGY
jgi:hypothetical protein